MKRGRKKKTSHQKSKSNTKRRKRKYNTCIHDFIEHEWKVEFRAFVNACWNGEIEFVEDFINKGILCIFLFPHSHISSMHSPYMYHYTGE